MKKASKLVQFGSDLMGIKKESIVYMDCDSSNLEFDIKLLFF